MVRVVIDIGTHKAQELRVLSGERSYVLYSYINWWVDWLKRIIKIIIRHGGLTKYGAGGYKVSPAKFSRKLHFRYLKQFLIPKNVLNGYKIIAIDPMPKLTSKYLKNLDKRNNITYLPIAILPHDEHGCSKITAFYQAKDTLSSSLYKEKNKDQIFTLCPSFNFSVVIESLREYGFVENGSNIILRMNCEGAELGIIQAIVNSNISIKNILGSLGDVEKKHGKNAWNQMKSIMERNLIQYSYFKGSDPSTWIHALKVFDNNE